ncbi:trimethylamine methyltransferase family protein, partial [Synergistaceae bacterium OttesenSCG-928-D05]|nr:trimethylamine methyltransferase family protein [Synergistaceae bacterium OttesenSCG-928-D05]
MSLESSNRMIRRRQQPAEPLQTATYSRMMDILSPEDLRRVDATSQSILAKTGLRIPLDEARLKQTEKLGLEVDFAEKRVRFPAGSIPELLAKAPRTYTLCARDPKYDLPLNGKKGYLCLDGSGTHILDPYTGEVRPSTKRDLEEATRAADALRQIAFLWPCLSAWDTPDAAQPLHELDAMLNNSSKHAQTMTAVTKETAQGSVDIAALVTGGYDALYERPIISSFQCSTSPLSYDPTSIEAAFVYAEYGIPCGFLDMTIGCGTAPASVAGNLVQGNAEVIGGIALLQLFFPGAKTFYGSCATVMELKTGGVAGGGPEDVLLQAATAQMARHYNVPSMAGTFATGAKRADWHAGVENTLSGVVSTISGAEMMCGAGMLHGATIFSFEQLVKDCEIFDICCRFTDGIRIDDDTLAEETIAEVGPGGSYLTDDHTLRHMYGQWAPSVFDRTPRDAQQEGETSGTDIKARRKAMDILASHTPAEL